LIKTPAIISSNRIGNIDPCSNPNLGRKSHRQPFTFQAQNKKERGLDKNKIGNEKPTQQPKPP